MGIQCNLVYFARREKKISESFQKLVGRRVSVVELGEKQAISNDRYDWEKAGISPFTSFLKIFYSLTL